MFLRLSCSTQQIVFVFPLPIGFVGRSRLVDELDVRIAAVQEPRVAIVQFHYEAPVIGGVTSLVSALQSFSRHRHTSE